MNNPSRLKDHRQIGQELDLFSFHEFAPGAVFWHPKGWIIYRTLQDFIRKKLSTEDYQEISTPVLVKNKIFQQSGHLELFLHNMFNLPIYEEEEIKKQLNLISQGKLPEDIEVRPINENKIYYPKANFSLKPMNCPESTLIYSSHTRSYNDLPIKLSDFGILHRRELSGVVGGLFRLRQFTIDDAHIYIRPDQIQEEIHKLIKLVKEFYDVFNFSPHFYFSTKPDKAMGDPKLWQEAERDLEQALKDAKVSYGVKQKEGAFYGPKIDIQIKDSQERDWQLATIQLDFQIPERLKLEYIDKDSKPKQPVIIHRAITGSLERFIGILTEHYQGAFPLWLSPVQVIVIPVADRHVEYAASIIRIIKEHGIRVSLDDRKETVSAKIRDATLQKVPYIGIIGDKEIQSSSRKSRDKVQSYEDSLISVRKREGEDLGQVKLSYFLNKLKEEIDKKI